MDDPIFAQFDKVTGSATPTNSSGTLSRADQVLTMERQTSPKPMLDKIGSSISQANEAGVAQTGAGLEDMKNSKNLGQFLQGGGKAVAGVTGVLSSGFAPIFQPVTDAISKGLAQPPAKGTLMDYLINTPEGQKFAMSENGQDASKIIETINNYAQGLGGVATIGAPLEEAAHTPITAPTPTALLDTAGDVGTKIADVAGQAKDAVMNKIKGVEPNDLQSLQEKISPKPTVKEARLATEQGRLYKAKEPSLFKEGGTDKVATSNQQAKSVRTIDRLIPDHGTMDEPTLYKALDEKIGETAKQLQPQMQATELKSETIQKISDDMENLKKTQMSEAKATDEPNVAKWQSNFEKIVTKNLKEGSSLNDVWNAAKEYDQSIKSNVKNATESSPEDLQTQKDIWLENRTVLRNAMNDAENGLGETSRQAFSDMRDMYEGQNGIMSKAKIEVTVKPSKTFQFIENHKTGIKIGGAALGGAGGIELGKKAIGF